MRECERGLLSEVKRYNKRHMAQEDHLKETKSKEELENTKSTIRFDCIFILRGRIDIHQSIYAV